jgi:hypothetical protein
MLIAGHCYMAQNLFIPWSWCLCYPSMNNNQKIRTSNLYSRYGKVRCWVCSYSLVGERMSEVLVACVRSTVGAVIGTGFDFSKRGRYLGMYLVEERIIF